MNPCEPEAGRTITTLSTREVYKNHWMRLREDQILRSNGKRGIYGVVEKEDAAIILPVDNGRVWLVEQFRSPSACGRWSCRRAGGRWRLRTLKSSPAGN